MQEDVRSRNSTTNGWKHSHCWHAGHNFLKWGIGFFIFGLIVGFGILIHFLVGSDYDHSNNFLINMTLWFGSPLSLSASYLQLGGLGMAAVGGACLALARCDRPDATVGTSTTGDYAHTSGQKNIALALCITGLIALFILGYIGYFVIDMIWPSFYYTPIIEGKNLWLILQGLSILCYLIGIIIAYSYLCCCCKKKCDYKS